MSVGHTEMVPHLTQIHTLNEVVAVLTLIVALLVVRIITTTNWSVLTSRIFLKKEEFSRFLRQFVYLIVVFAAFLAVANIIPVLGMEERVYDVAGQLVAMHWVSDISTTVAYMLVLSAMFFLYSFLKEVEVKKSKAGSSVGE